MAEYIRREDAIKAVDNLCHVYYPANKAKLEAIPSADVAEVVRCKDCSYAHKTSFPSELRICLTTGCFHSENHFCSDGKRMDGE